MSKLTKLQRGQINQILSCLTQSIEFLSRPDVTVARRQQDANTTLHFTRQPVPDCLLNDEQKKLGNYSLYEIDAFLGCELATLHTAQQQLRRVLEVV